MSVPCVKVFCTSVVTLCLPVYRSLCVCAGVSAHAASPRDCICASVCDATTLCLCTCMCVHVCASMHECVFPPAKQ